MAIETQASDNRGKIGVWLLSGNWLAAEWQSGGHQMEHKHGTQFVVDYGQSNCNHMSIEWRSRGFEMTTQWQPNITADWQSHDFSTVIWMTN